MIQKLSDKCRNKGHLICLIFIFICTFICTISFSYEYTTQPPSIAMISQNENSVSNFKTETIEQKEMTHRLIKYQWFAKSMFAKTISEMPAYNVISIKGKCRII